MSAIGSSFPGISLSVFRQQFKRISERKPDRSTNKAVLKKITNVLVNTVSNDPRLLGAFRVELVKLAPVYERIAEIDQSFLTNHAHPARLFIELLAHKSLTYSSEDDPGFLAFIEPVKHAIGVYAGSKQNPLKSLPQVQSWLEKKWESIDTRAEKIQNSKSFLFEKSNERNVQAYQVRKELRAKYKNLVSAPTYIKNFVDGPWSNLIAHIELSGSQNAWTRDKALDTLTSLLWSIDTKSVKNDREKLISLIPKLVKNLKDGMLILGVDRENIEMEMFLTRLMKHHGAVMINTKRLNDNLPPIDEGMNSPFDGKRPDETDQDIAIWLTPAEQKAIGKLQVAHQRDHANTDFMNTNIMTPGSPDNDAITHEKISTNHLETLESIDDATVNSWFEIKINVIWQRMLLKWTNAQNSTNATMFMFEKASGETVSMTNRQFQRLNDDRRVMLLMRRGIMVDALEKLMPESPRLTHLGVAVGGGERW
ncbi:MAG: DUF1631 family protein [Methylotenera sp.]|nr:DUF1631 family protein [Methylotenera sp.]